LLTPLINRKRSGLLKYSGKYGLFCPADLKNNVFPAGVLKNQLTTIKHDVGTDG
jgi:hypothetical protein